MQWRGLCDARYLAPVLLVAAVIGLHGCSGARGTRGEGANLNGELVCSTAVDPLEELVEASHHHEPGPCLEQLDGDGDGRFEQTIRHEYDKSGRPVAIISARTRVKAGKRVEERQVLRFTRDGKGRLDSIQHDIDDDGEPDRVERFIYDEKGLLLHRDIDDGGDGDPDLRARYRFGGACQLRQIELSSLQQNVVLRRVSFDYDDGKLEEVITLNARSAGTKATVEWEDARPKGIKLDINGDGSVEQRSEYRYNAQGQLRELREIDATGQLVSRRLHSYDGNGHLRSLRFERPGQGLIAQRRFTYTCERPETEPAPATSPGVKTKPAPEAAPPAPEKPVRSIQ